jgi:ferrous iron transport protein B
LKLEKSSDAIFSASPAVESVKNVKKPPVIALAGNPNCGKTTLFNQLTGSNQYVGNWAGVTVEKKSGFAAVDGQKVEIIDLPGIYSLSTYTMEENIARDYIESDEPSVIINIIDASHLERNLFLTLQLIEMNKPMVAALNMMDVLESRGDMLDIPTLSAELGIPVIPITASRGIGLTELMRAAVAQTERPQPRTFYRTQLQSTLESLAELFGDVPCPMMHAAGYFEEGRSFVHSHKLPEENLQKMDALIEGYMAEETMDRDMVISAGKYDYIEAVIHRAVKKAPIKGMTLTEKIDRFVTNRFLAIPFFLAVMFVVFFVSFGPLGVLLKGWFEYLINDVAIAGMERLLISANASPWAVSLVVDGALAGVGAVLSFLPQIALLFLMLSILEDSGYMARAAFIMDRMLGRFGLSGKSFIPMLMGFGCTVPALMASRTLENERDRRLTMMVTPFMSCSARMTVYAIIAGVFFPKNTYVVIFSIYVLGIAFSLLSAILLSRRVMKGEKSGFLLELPEYRFPTARNLWLHTWDKVKGFVVKAGTLLLVSCIVIWFLQTFDFSFRMVENSADSMFGHIGKFLAPVFAPLGFGDWRAVMALLTGIIAKEAVVGTLGILFAVQDASVAALSAPLAAVFTPPAAYAFMVFVLLYIPCVAALATMYREMRSLKWTLFTVGYELAAAWVVAFLVYQIGSLL